MAKHKLERWHELGTFNNVIQPAKDGAGGKDHPIKGNWRKEIFRNENPIIIELGCGKGEYTTGLSAIFPDRNFIGVDIKGARMWRGAKTASENQSVNTAFLRTRIEFIDSFFCEDEADEIWITFPDPHPAKKNSNKRLTCPWFLNKYRTFLKDNGIIHLKSDNSELFNYTRRLISENQLELLMSTNDLYSGSGVDMAFLKKIFRYSQNEIGGEVTDKILDIRTHYEKIFLKEGLKINYLAFRLEKEKKIEDEWQKEIFR